MEINKLSDTGKYHVMSDSFSAIFESFIKSGCYVQLWRKDGYLFDIVDSDAFYKAWREMKCREDEK